MQLGKWVTLGHNEAIACQDDV